MQAVELLAALETQMGREQGSALLARVWQHIRKKLVQVAMNVRKIGEDDPRRVIHSFKVGLALTLVSLFYYFRPLYNGFGVAAMWAVLTVVVVFEYTVGATLSKGLNRVFATLLAGCLATGVHYLAALSGKEAEPVLLGAFVFLLAAAATFSRFFPHIKARYDYGAVIFILTFSLVAVSGYRVDELIELAHQRLSTIAIGTSTCVFIAIFICPVWAGQDLHETISKNIDKLACFLEVFSGECFMREEEGEGVSAPGEKTFPQGYKSVLDSKSSEESMANFARWEPAHGRFGFRHPWKQYLKIGSLSRECACSIQALSACVRSKTKAPTGFQRQIQEPCSRISSECGKALTELATAIKTMTRPISVPQHVAAAVSAAAELRSTLKTALLENSTLLELLPIVAIASLLVETITHVEKLVESVHELAAMAEFRDPAEVGRTPFLHQGAVTPVPEAEDPHVVVDICGAEVGPSGTGEQPINASHGAV